MSGPSAATSHSSSFQLDTVLNFRDVGATINRLAGKKLIREGLLFRSARPDEASSSDRRKLLNEIGIKTVIDLRSKTEHINQAQKRNANISSSAVVPQTNDTISEPVKLPGVNYAEINLNGGAFERALLWKLSWFDMAHLFGLMALGYRNEGISILGEKVMQPRGLTGLGIDTLDSSHQELRKFFDVLGKPDNYPLLIHCTQGKDRTGLTVLLILALLHVDAQWIQTDYLMSEKELEPEKEERMKEITSFGLTEEFAGCPVDFVERVFAHINGKYGSVEKYLDDASIDASLQGAVKKNLAINV